MDASGEPLELISCRTSSFLPALAQLLCQLKIKRVGVNSASLSWHEMSVEQHGARLLGDAQEESLQDVSATGNGFTPLHPQSFHTLVLLRTQPGQDVNVSSF